MSSSNTIIIPGFRGRIVTSKDKDYDECRQQYATSSFPLEQMSPYMITYPTDEEDIQLVLKYASSIKKSVIVRSGGCQYSGLSSGNSSEIIIDMNEFHKTNNNGDIAIQNNEFKMNITNSIETGGNIEIEAHGNIDFSDIELKASGDVFVSFPPATKLDGIGKFLTKNRIALPFGDCAPVNIGGHVQTGGYGNILRGFGLCLDHVVGFDIITSDGKLRTIKRPDVNDNDGDYDNKYDPMEVKSNDEKLSNDNRDLFWAVTGGNPCSFGVLTKYRFKCIKDDDHPNSAGVFIIFLYTKQVLKTMLKEFTKLLTTNKPPPDYDFLMTINSISYGHGIIVFQGLYSNIKGEKEDYDEKWFQPFIDSGTCLKKNIEDDVKEEIRKLPSDLVNDVLKVLKKCNKDDDNQTQELEKILNFLKSLPSWRDPASRFHGKHPISEMMANCILLEKPREFDLPYKKTLRGTIQCWKNEFIDSYCDKIDEIIHKRSYFRVVSQLQLGGGAYFTNDPYSKITAIANRNIITGFSFDVFYDVNIDKDAERKVTEFQNNCAKEWVGEGRLFSNQDIRMTWGTFGDTNIEDVYQYYYNPDADKRYATLRRIKTKFDPNNLFHNNFTIPPLNN